MSETAMVQDLARLAAVAHALPPTDEPASAAGFSAGGAALPSPFPTGKAGKGKRRNKAQAGHDACRILQVVGNLMEPAGIYPERYLVRDFPSDYQLEMIGQLIEP